MTAERRSYLFNLRQYPQMTANESQVARAWLVQHADEFDDVDFNVRIGTALELGAGFDDATRRQAAIVTQKRADMVATKGTAVTIVEVKIRVSLAAMGQLLGYDVLYRLDYPQTSSVRLVAIGYDALLDAASLLLAHNISVELFKDVTLVLQPYV